MLFALGDDHGGTIVVSVARVETRSAASARDLRNLADTDGTGNVSPLPGDLVGAGHLRWTGMNYNSRRAGSLVVIAEVEPLRGAPAPAFMDGIADVAAEFPRP